LWAWRSRRSRQAASAIEAHRRGLYEASFLPAVDAMSGTQFELYVADLMRTTGAREVVHTGGPGDGGADVLAVVASGRPVAIQCKRQFSTTPVGVIREMAGTLAHEHPGRYGVLVTTMLLTKPATELAARAGITVVDRNALAGWMASIRQVLEQPEEVTVHLLAAGEAGDPWVVDKLRRAAADARSRGAPDVAALCLQRALAEPPPAAARADVLLELGSVQALHAPAAAVGHLEEALAATPDWPRRGAARSCSRSATRSRCAGGSPTPSTCCKRQSATTGTIAAR
jgi:hypothetical protein